MTRPKSPRFVTGEPQVSWFKPAGVKMKFLHEVALSLDEIEAIRLADMEGYYQEQVAAQMNISRQTVGRILTGARRKIADALVQGKAIRLEGGRIQCEGGGNCCDHCVDGRVILDSLKVSPPDKSDE